MNPSDPDATLDAKTERTARQVVKFSPFLCLASGVLLLIKLLGLPAKDASETSLDFWAARIVLGAVAAYYLIVGMGLWRRALWAWRATFLMPLVVTSIPMVVLLRSNNSPWQALIPLFMGAFLTGTMFSRRLGKRGSWWMCRRYFH